MEITKMTIQDLDSISSILETDFDDFWHYNILAKELKSSNSLYIAIKEAAEIIGFAGITIVLDTAELNNIVIKKSHRGSGYASSLLAKIIELSKERHCTKINLEVSSSNTVAISLYKKFGFEQVGLRKGYYNGEDALLYTKDLN